MKNHQIQSHSQNSQKNQIEVYKTHPMHLQNDQDFQKILRNSENSIKYQYSFLGKKCNPDTTIVLSYADMQFKFSSQLHQKFLEYQQAKPFQHFGYAKLTLNQMQILKKYIQENFYKNLKQQWILVWQSVLSAYNNLLFALTQKNDKVLFLTPLYYFFIKNTKQHSRIPIQCNLQQKDNRLMINFDKLQEIFQKNQIKLFVFINPHNPSGRVWSQQQLNKISKLVQKYKCYIFSDQIFGVSVLENYQKQFTSMLKFENIHNQLICSTSLSKAFNCSGQAIGFTFSPNSQITAKLDSEKYLAGNLPQQLSIDLLMICIKDGQKWKRKCIQYITYNQKMLKEICKNQLPKLKIYDLQAAYLLLVDFKQYNLRGDQLMKMLQEIQVLPTLMQDTFVQKKPRSLVRINIACNYKVLQEALYRISKKVNELSSENVQKSSKEQI